LHLALDLGNRTRKLAFTTSIAHAPRLWTITARDLPNLTRRSWPQERASASRRTPRCWRAMYRARVAAGGRRLRRIGIVVVARKLLAL